MGLVIAESRRRWPGGVIPYEIASKDVPSSTARRLKFWCHRKQILKRCRSDPGFRQMWWDYSDVLVSLVSIESEANQLCRLRDELEAEIIDTLH
ncbi:MAG: hypothetical protein O7G86_02735 [Gammaproteobacteria bacterium]|nr:hypothetical protein [Gammaproteobacteria bacterium]